MPGKTKVSFKQWYHKVQCVKENWWSGRVLSGHWKGQQWIWPSIWVLLLAWPIYCRNWPLFFYIVVSFDILMQNFYKVTLGNHEKVPLEGTLNQIRLQCPGRVTNLEVQQHLKDHLFHGICKHIWDSIRCLYSTPGPLILSWWLLPIRWKVGMKVWGKVRARAAVTTNAGKCTTDLGHPDCQIDGCPDQGRATAQPASQIAPDREAMGGDR